MNQVKQNQIVILADIGGTNARFWCRRSDENLVKLLWRGECADFSSFEQALDHVFSLLNDKNAQIALILAVAGPVQADQIKITNNHWAFSQQALVAHYQLSLLKVVNDLEGAALCYPRLSEQDKILLYGCKTEGKKALQANKTVGFVGLGTGLGAAQIFKDEKGHFHALSSEAGQQSFAVQNAQDWALKNFYKDKNVKSDHFPAEFFISGSGIVNIYRALYSQAKTKPEAVLDNGFSIMQAAHKRQCPVAMESAALFFRLFGAWLGNYALVTGCRSGIYIVSQVLLTWKEMLIESDFYEAFCDKGKFDGYLKDIPIYLVTHDSPTLLGLETLYHQSS